MTYLGWYVDQKIEGVWESRGHRKTQAGAEALLERLAKRRIYGFQKTGEAYGEPILEAHGFRLICGWVTSKK